MDVYLQYLDLLLLVVSIGTSGHTKGLSVRIVSYPSEPYPVADWIFFACLVTGNTSTVTYNWTTICSSQDPPLVTNTYVNRNNSGQFDLQVRSSPDRCTHDTVMCNASDMSGNTGHATWRIGRMTGAGLWWVNLTPIQNVSALRASEGGDIGTIYCHSSTNDSNVGRWISPQGLDITRNFTDPFSIQFNNGPGYPSYSTLQLHNPFLQPFTSTYEGIYSCVVPDDQRIMQTLHIGIYSNQYSNVLAPLLDRVGRVSESPLTLNSPTTGLPPTIITWKKGVESVEFRLENGTTYGITTVLRERHTSMFDNLLRINQTPQQAKGLYYFQAENAIEGPIQRLDKEATISSYSLPLLCSFDGSSSYVWVDEESNEVFNGSNITFYANDSIHHKLFTCIGKNATSDVGFEHIKFVINVPMETLHVTAQSDDSVPILGQSYSMDCVGHKIYSGVLNMPSLQWVLTNETLLSSSNGIQLHGPRTVGQSSELVAQFSILRTSHAGTYTCQASLSSPALTSPIIKNVSFGITVQIPTPTVTLTVLSSEPHVVGGTFSLQCEATVSHHVDTLVSVDFTWRRTSRPLTGNSDSRVTISKTGSDPTYWSILTINELRIGTDSNMSYTCQAVVISDPPSPFILNSISGTSDAYLLDVLGIRVSVSVTPEQIAVLDVPPFNSFTLTCSASTVSNSSLTMVFMWLRQVLGGESPTELIHNGGSVVIVTSGDTSTLTTSEAQSGGYVYNCSVTIGDAEASSDTAIISIRGPTLPVAATNIESTVTSFSTVILAWTVSRVAYTPETYTVVYGTNQLSLDQRSDSVNGTSGTTHYSVELTQLQHSTQHYYQVESVNTVGITHSEISTFDVQNASVIISITSTDSFPTAGSNFTFMCSVVELVDHSGGTIVTWRDPRGQSILSQGDFTIIRLNTSQRVDYTLQVDPLKVSHRGQYTCDVSIPNVGFHDSKTVSIQVIPGNLGVTVQSNGTSQVGTPYHLACQIGNSLTPSIGPVVYEWTSTCLGECFILRQPGTATASTQYLKAVDSGTHTCTVTDSVGNQGSASVNVSATGVGIYHSSNGLLSNNSVVIASNGFLQGSFFCLSGRAEAGIGRWIAPNGNDFTLSETHAFEVTVGGEDNPGVVEISLSSYDSRFPVGQWDGVYSCVIPDETGVEQIIHLGIYLLFGGSSPQPVVQPLSASSLGLYPHFTLNCSSGVSSATEVTWTKDRQHLNINNQEYSTFQIMKEGTNSSYDNLLLVTTRDVNEHSGQYGCTVRNRFGSATRSETFLGIQISEHGIFALGSEVSVACSSDFGVNSIVWLKGGRTVSTHRGSEGNLHIQSVTESDHGNQYTCRATAPFGIQEHSIIIQVEVNPDSALSLSVTSSATPPREGSGFSLTCMARKSPHLLSTPTINWYDSMGNRIVTDSGIRLGPPVESGDGTVVRSLTFVSLDPSHTMEYRCNATIRFHPPPYIISKETIWNLVVQDIKGTPVLPTGETDQSGQSESLYIGAGIGVGVVIILFVIVIIAIVVWWKRVQTQKIRQRQRQTEDVIFKNKAAVPIEMSQNPIYRPAASMSMTAKPGCGLSGGRVFRGPGVTQSVILPRSKLHHGPKLPPRNELYMGPATTYESYTCMNAGVMDYIQQHCQPLHGPSSTSMSENSDDFYDEIASTDDDQSQDDYYVNDDEVIFNLPPRETEKGKDDASEKPEIPIEDDYYI